MKKRFKNDPNTFWFVTQPYRIFSKLLKNGATNLFAFLENMKPSSINPNYLALG